MTILIQKTNSKLVKLLTFQDDGKIMCMQAYKMSACKSLNE